MALPPQFTPELMNALYRRHEEMDDPGERKEWLGRELERRGLAAWRGEVEQAFANVLGGGSPSPAIGSGSEEQAAWAVHDAEMRRLNPWLDDKNFEWACWRARYYAWHDGPGTDGPPSEG
jgi:hypothetical protein